MLLGLTGFKGSGKNTVADYLTEKYGFEQLSFAAKVKESVNALFDWDLDQIEYLKNEPEAFVMVKIPGQGVTAKMSVREFLQRYGVEAHRDVFGDNFWLDQVLPDEKYPVRGWYDRNAVVTDVRFENEVKRVKANGGRIINIVRPTTAAQDHASEQPIETELINYTIQNNGSVNDLYKAVDEFLISVLLNAAG